MIKRILVTAIAGLMLVSFSSRAEAQQQKLVKSGTFVIEGKSIGFLIGFRWGTGTLTLIDGTRLKFSFKGVKAIETGAAIVKATGIVYNMKHVTDFEGLYSGLSGSLTLGKGLTGFINYKNDTSGVIVSVKPSSKGIRLSAPAPGGVSVSFTN